MPPQRHSLANLPHVVKTTIVSHLDSQDDLESLRATCRSFAYQVPNPNTTPAPFLPPTSVPNQTTTHVVHFSNPFGNTSSHTASHTPSPISRVNSTSTYATEVSSPFEEEPSFNFDITADLTRRLSLLPTHRTKATLPHLPTELQLQIFSYLDKIDATCLGLAHPTTYMMYRSIYGLKMPLNTRRSGPNNLERAWEVVGKQECRHCGVYRCELYKHIQGWMQGCGPTKLGLEYCNMAMKFGHAGEGHSENCFRVKPSKPRRCGKHPVRTTTVHQDDNSAASGAILAFASANAEATLPGA